MSFAENLKKIRMDRDLSQGELAELVGVSRQAVSRWEKDEGYPEVEKFLLLSTRLNVSMDYLMFDTEPAYDLDESLVDGKTIIKTRAGKSIAACYRVETNSIFKSTEEEPRYALFGISGKKFWGENPIFLAWYADEESLNKELNEITEAIENNDNVYQIKYDGRTRSKKLNVDSKQ